MSRSLRRSEKYLAGKGFFMAIRVNQSIEVEQEDVLQRYIIFPNRPHLQERKIQSKSELFWLAFTLAEGSKSESKPESRLPPRSL